MSRPYLYRANRTAARIALYASMVIAGTVAVGLLTLMGMPGANYVQDLGWLPGIDYASQEDVQLFAGYLRIDTTRETGDELAGARYLAGILAKEGIATEVLAMGEGRANLIATLEGRTREALILHNHIDVEPILHPEAWTFDPFGAEIEMPWIYGRGAFDMKGVAIAQLMAMIQLRRSGVTPARDVVFLATSGEESGSELGTLWLLEERPGLFDNAWGVISEGGVVEARTPDNIKYWGTEAGQKRYVKLLACSPSQQRLEALLQDILAAEPPLEDLRLRPEVADFLRSYAPSRDLPTHRRQLADPEPTFEDPELFNRFADYHRSLFRDEISPFPVQAAADGSGYQMRITVALLADGDLEASLARLLPDWMTHGVHLVVLPNQGSAALSDISHPIPRQIERLIADRFGDAHVGPYYQMRSATDARFFRERGIPSYGFSPFLVLTTDTLGIGGPNEGIALPAFSLGVELYVELVARLAGTPL